MKSNNTKMEFLPKDIVSDLDRFIVGQANAKRAVAIALRNRSRRLKLQEPMRSEIVPKNILMIGSTGVGKTEIARRLARLVNAPFIKVEATKFTEVGYVGRDVESIIRDLVTCAISQNKSKAKKQVEKQARVRAINRILDNVAGSSASGETRKRFENKINGGELDHTEIDISVKLIAKDSLDIMPNASMGVINISEMIGKTFGGDNRMVQKTLTVKDAMNIIIAEESEKLIDEDKLIAEAINAVENNGIVFLDEIDKITSSNNNAKADVSREGVQRDLLPLIEGTNVATKHGTVKTDHILFIASGAFHLSKPSDLLPELQGRLPVRVEMSNLTKDDLIRILKEPESSLIKQYQALIETEGVELIFSDDAINEIASQAITFNTEIENIGARRLHTILEKILEDVNFNAGSSSEDKITIDAKYIKDRLEGFAGNVDLAKFIL